MFVVRERKALLDPESLPALDPMTPGERVDALPQNHLAAMQRALKVIEETELRFSAHFGRFYGGALSKYRMDDAEVALCDHRRNERRGNGRCG